MTCSTSRITLPYVAAGPDWGLLDGRDTGNVNPPNYVPTKDQTGLSDTALFDFLIFNAPWEGGKLAAGLSANPLTVDPMEINDIEVEATVMNGRITYMHSNQGTYPH